jgi:hypothetical protein
VQLTTSKPKPKDLSQPKMSQKAILSSVVKRKCQTSTKEPPAKRQFPKVQQPTALRLLAVLPGIGDYKSSDDSDGSSDLDEAVAGTMDLTGRIRKKKECDE